MLGRLTDCPLFALVRNRLGPWRLSRASGPLARRTGGGGKLDTRKRNHARDGTRYSGGEHRLTCPGTCCFVFWLIGCKPIGSANWITTVGVSSTESGRGLRNELSASWLTSSDPEPS